MTRARVPSFIAVIPIALLIAACTAPERVAGTSVVATPSLAVGANSAAPSPAAGIPEIAFYNSSSGITVVDQNGAGNALGPSGSNINWGRGGSGTLASPFHLVYNSASTQQIMLADVYLDAGRDKLVNARSVPTLNGNANPALSGDTLITFYTTPGGTAVSRLSTVNSNGTNEQVRFTTPGGYALARPVFSPDGQKIAVIMFDIFSNVATKSIEVIDLMSSNSRTTVLTAGSSGLSFQDLDWTDNNELIITAFEISSGIYKIYGLDMNNPSSGPNFITNGQSAAASADGSQIVYTPLCSNKCNQSLVIYNRAAKTNRTVVSGYAYGAAWRK